MRDYGKVYSTFWSSQTTHSLSDDGKLLALYLMTCSHSTISGVFRLPDGYVSEDIGWDQTRVAKGFNELLANGFANRCETTKWVWVVKHLEWNKPENPNQRKSAAKIAQSVPDQCAWKRAFMRDCADLLGLPATEKSNPSGTVTEPFLNQEQEQEQDKDIPAADAPVVVPIAAPKQKPKAVKRPLPDGWTPDPGVPESLAAEFQTTERTILGPYLDGFRDACRANGYQYADFNAAFRNCVRQDWPKVRAKPQAFGKKPPDDLQALFARGAG